MANRNRRISLVKAKHKAFNNGVLAEQVDPTQEQAARFDSFILSEPGVPATKLDRTDPKKIIDEVVVLFHLYSNLQGF